MKNELTPRIEVLRNTLANTRAGRLALGLTLGGALLTATACGSDKEAPMPSATETQVSATEESLQLFCPPYLFTLESGDSIASIKEETFSSQSSDGIKVVNEEGTPVSSAEEGDTIRFIDPACS